MTTDRPPWRSWVPEAAGAVAVLLLGVLSVSASTRVTSSAILLVVVLGAAASVLLSRKAPALALALIWATALLQALGAIVAVEILAAAIVVAFGCARWGRVATVVAAGLSIPVALAGAGLILYLGPRLLLTMLGAFRGLADLAVRFGDVLQINTAVLAFVIMALPLTLPWMVGLALRFKDKAEVSRVAAQADALRAQRETAQAQEIAQLRAEQNRLARDVHDVVGHSLAVILAQAESAQYLPDDDPEALKKTMSTIATSARTSLQDVRQVLAAQPSDAPRAGELDSLIEGARTSGHDIVSAEAGTPQPLPPELEVVAFRVLQEMLTNAIRHGRRDHPVLVGRQWPDGGSGELRIEVRNAVADPVESAGGQGLDGMRRRLESVGGRIDVRRATDADGPSFTATAWVPVRAGTR